MIEFNVIMNILSNICKRLRRDKVFWINYFHDLFSEYGDDAVKAVSALAYNKVFRLVFDNNYSINTFSGEKQDYIIFENSNYCGCFSQYPINLAKRKVCYHLIAYKLLKALGYTIEIKFPEKKFDEIFKYLKFDEDIS